MDSRERPTGRHFLIRPLEWERIRALKGTPHYELHVRHAQEQAKAVVRAPLQPWDATLDENNWTQVERYLDLLDLTTLYLLEGDERCAQACRRDALTMAQVSEANGSRLLSQSGIEATYICRTLIFVHEWLSEFFTPEERERIRQTCLRTLPHHASEMARSTVNQKLVQNHLLFNSTGMAMVALSFNDISDAGRWGLFAAETATRYLRDAFHADGAQNEVAPSYHFHCLELGLLNAAVLRDFAGRDLLREDWFRGVMERGLDWLASLVTPAGSLVAFNDSNYKVASWYFRFGASQFNSPHFQALAGLVERAAEPERSNLLFDLLYYEPSIPARFHPAARRVFPVSGTAVFRSGYGAQDGLLAQHAGTYIGGHAHRDRLGFEFWHSGKCLLRDPGGQKDDWPTFVGYLKEASAHNVVAIHEPHEMEFEGKFRDREKFHSEHRGHAKSQGRILGTQEDAAFAAIVSQAEIYAGVRQKRSLVWCKESGLLLILDEILAEQVHTFDQLFHGCGDLAIKGTGFTFQDAPVSLAGAVLLPAQAELLPIRRPEKAEGALSYLAVRTRGSRVNFLTLLEPFQGKRPPERRLDASGELRLEVSGQRLVLQASPEAFQVRLGEQTLLPA